MDSCAEVKGGEPETAPLQDEKKLIIPHNKRKLKQRKKDEFGV